jgi:predicted outer membrane protein
MSKLNALMVVAAIALLAPPVTAQDRPTGPDQELVGQLHQLGQEEIAMSQIGVTRGVRPDVRRLAAAVQRDERAMSNGLEVYAQRKNMNPAAIENPGNALASGVLALAPLTNSPTAQFDYTFATTMVSKHQGQLDAAAAAYRLARDPELKGLISDNMRLMAAHLVSAQALLAGIPEPTPRVLSLPAFPSGASRTQTGADEPPPEAWQNIPTLQPLQ